MIQIVGHISCSNRGAPLSARAAARANKRAGLPQPSRVDLLAQHNRGGPAATRQAVQVAQTTGFRLYLLSAGAQADATHRAAGVLGFGCAQGWVVSARAKPSTRWRCGQRGSVLLYVALHSVRVSVMLVHRPQRGGGGCKLGCGGADDGRAIRKFFKTRSLPTASLHPGVLLSSPFCSPQNYACPHIYMYIHIHICTHIYISIHA